MPSNNLTDKPIGGLTSNGSAIVSAAGSAVSGSASGLTHSISRREALTLMGSFAASVVLAGCNDEDHADMIYGKNHDGNGGGGYSHTIRFDSNGGSGNVPSSITKLCGSHITLPALSDNGGLPIFIRSLDTLDLSEWNTRSDGSGVNYDALPGNSYTITDDITLYAKWS